MEKENMIEIENVSMRFNLGIEKGFSLKQWFVDLGKHKKKVKNEFWALKNVNVEIKKGEVVGFIGSNGAGKSTLLKLIMNQLQPTKGEIVINGINLQELDLNSYYSHIKYLNKTPVFYKESLRTNMIFDRLFLENKMIELLHYFMLDDLVNGLDLKLDEQGGFLSSGQGQLVMIIRALLSEPDVLILDEAFSNIDQERLQLLINYLSFQKIIVIIVSHQINMMNCQFDCVIIDSGKIVGEEDYGNRFST